MIIKLNLVVNRVQLGPFPIKKQVQKNLVLMENQASLLEAKRNLRLKGRKVLILKSTNSSSDLIEVRKMWNYCNYL